MRDWSRVPYPTWWVERAARRREELDAAVERLRAAIRSAPEIVGALVYGSYASGHVGPESDLDLMVVTTLPVVAADPGARYVRIRKILDLRVASDMFVYAPEEFARLRDERSFFAQAWREGLWIDAAASG